MITNAEQIYRPIVNVLNLLYEHMGGTSGTGMKIIADSLPLPEGAATADKQDVGNAHVDDAWLNARAGTHDGR